MKTIDFSDLVVQSVPVVGPDGKNYTLREASGRVAKEHRNATMRAVKLGPDGKVASMDGLADVESKFVSGCLFDEKEKNPAPAIIESWPARVQKRLYEAAKELSHIGEADSLNKSLRSALSLEGAPVTLSVLHDWAKGLDQEEYGSLSTLFSAESEEDSLKN